MNIDYTYEIISVDENFKTMEIVYSSDGRRTYHVGAPMPDSGQTVESVVEQYAPILEWQEDQRQVESVQVGATGVKSVNTAPDPGPDASAEIESVLESFPLANKRSIALVDALDTKFIKTVPVYTKKNNLVAIELRASSEQLTSSEGTTMFNNATKIIDVAKAEGLMVVAIATLQNVIDFLVDVHSFTEVSLSDGSKLLHTPFDATMQTNYDASAVPRDTSLTYIERFTQQEHIDIATASLSDIEVKIFYDKLLAAQEANYTDPRILAGLDFLVSKSLITQARRDELAQPPE